MISEIFRKIHCDDGGIKNVTTLEERIPELIELLKPLYEYSYYDLERILDKSCYVYQVNEKDELVAFGRSITDGVMQTVIYDVIVREDCRRNGRGKSIVGNLIEMWRTKVTILYYEPGSVEFYKKIGFKHFSNGMYRLKNG